MLPIRQLKMWQRKPSGGARHMIIHIKTCLSKISLNYIVKILFIDSYSGLIQTTRMSIAVR